MSSVTTSATGLNTLNWWARVALRPERDDRFKRRAARQATGNLRDENHRIIRQLETQTRPCLHPLKRGSMVGKLVTGAQHRLSLAKGSNPTYSRLSGH